MEEKSINIAELKLVANQIDSIQKKYEAIDQATGNNYNIFQVLGIQSREVKLHSKLLADLLNPDGWHGMGPAFLQLFLEENNLEKEKETFYTADDLKQVKCLVEKYCGPKDDEKITGGFIDILIEGGKLKLPIVIENKIYAGDQDNQLLRYYNTLNKNCELFYLTLYGHEPSGRSTGDGKLSKDSYKCISYSSHILSWLKNCHQITIDKPLVRETIKQYINLIKTLTGQSPNDKKQMEINQIIEKNKAVLGELNQQAQNFIDNHLNHLIGSITEATLEKLNGTVSFFEQPVSSFHKEDGGTQYAHFKIGSPDNGVCFEVRVMRNKLSLWTSAWLMKPREETYGKYDDLIQAIGAVGRYEKPLVSTDPIEELAAEMEKGIEACQKYHDDYLKK